MANFGLSFIDPLTGQPDITANGSTITIVDNSNYDTSTESGHLQADFNAFYKIKIVCPDNSEYLFSSIGDGDASLTVPSLSTLPITTVYPYTTGDGLYVITMYALPSYSKTGVYNAGLDYVYEAGIVYKSLTGVNSAPTGNPADWQVITDIETLPTKYRLTQNVAVTCAAQSCYAAAVANAMCAIEGLACNSDLCSNASFLKAAQLMMIIDNITILANQQNWVAVAHLINFAKSLCCCAND